jgi:hypothetical protein
MEYPQPSKSKKVVATQEAEIRRIKVLSHPGQIVYKILSLKNPSQKRVME